MNIQQYKMSGRPICLRVTRACNAKCSFCLAPPDNLLIPVDQIFARLTAIRKLGFRNVDLCGGEPTIRNDLNQIIDKCIELKMIPSITTNGIHIPDSLLVSLAKTKIVKVSIHGGKDAHDKIVGVPGSWLKLSANIDKMLKAGINICVQTVVHADCSNDLDDVVKFCLEKGITLLRLAPFVPRGEGKNVKEQMTLSAEERKALITRSRESIEKEKLNTRWLNFSSPMFVIETSGDLMLEGADEENDICIGNILDLVK